jgi:hypothetical protein
MKRLVLVPVLCCSLVISGTSAADLTCKAIATWQRLAGEALFSFVKKCETDAYAACEEQALDKKLTGLALDSFTHECVPKAMGMGPRWCVPHYCRDTSDCAGGAGCDVCWGGLCGN